MPAIPLAGLAVPGGGIVLIPGPSLAVASLPAIVLIATSHVTLAHNV